MVEVVQAERELKLLLSLVAILVLVLVTVIVTRTKSQSLVVVLGSCRDDECLFEEKMCVCLHLKLSMCMNERVGKKFRRACISRRDKGSSHTSLVCFKILLTEAAIDHDGTG